MIKKINKNFFLFLIATLFSHQGYAPLSTEVMSALDKLKNKELFSIIEQEKNLNASEIYSLLKNKALTFTDQSKDLKDFIKLLDTLTTSLGNTMEIEKDFVITPPLNNTSAMEIEKNFTNLESEQKKIEQEAYRGVEKIIEVINQEREINEINIKSVDKKIKKLSTEKDKINKLKKFIEALNKQKEEMQEQIENLKNRSILNEQLFLTKKKALEEEFQNRAKLLSDQFSRSTEQNNKDQTNIDELKKALYALTKNTEDRDKKIEILSSKIEELLIKNEQEKIIFTKENNKLNDELNLLKLKNTHAQDQKKN
ncbi:hypothetical protein HE1_01020 [Holospora elegans E1]|uniref:Uncharacterized protein n=1 Tax=Holospora elegans E1 TaxID=1427503 RepID=A0A023E0T4_9PROT|nr:hypothetical protein [Holospora elegans]GAJ46682.1 hypothetical protein HE1_01020 [Holospora elegans E1]